MSEAQEQIEDVARDAWTDVEVRVIGALVEKQITTPDGYPLSMNALKNACNQKSSRDPVMELDERTIDDAIYNLRQKKLLIATTPAGSHVLKYKHDLPGYFGLEDKEVAVMCVLMLRGPQTPGEIRGRTGRMYAFESVADVVDTVNELMRRIDPPIITRLPREAGRKEQRYMHLLAGDAPVAEAGVGQSEQQEVPLHRRGVPLERDGVGPSAPSNEITDLKGEVASLRQELAEIKDQFAEFRKQFE